MIVVSITPTHHFLPLLTVLEKIKKKPSPIGKRKYAAVIEEFPMSPPPFVKFVFSIILNPSSANQTERASIKLLLRSQYISLCRYSFPSFFKSEAIMRENASAWYIVISPVALPREDQKDSNGSIARIPARVSQKIYKANGVKNRSCLRDSRYERSTIRVYTQNIVSISTKP